MESGYIEDCQITSSEAPDEAAPAHNARLNMPNTAWKIYGQHGIATHDTWLAIDLLRNATITSIATQGGSRVGTSNDFEGTTGSFQFLYGTERDVYMVATPRIQTDPNHRTYFEHAILDPSVVKHHYLLTAVDARYVLIKLESYCSQNFNSLRIELFGCYYEENGEQTNKECYNTDSQWSNINEADRGFMVMDGQLFVCNSLPLRLEYTDTAAGKRCYYLFTSHNWLGSYCLQQSDSSSWSRLSTDVNMLLGYESQSFVIYGTRNSRHNKIIIRSIDRGRSWQTISLWKYLGIKSSATFVPITSVPSTSTDDMNWLNPSNILNDYISENRGASYDGLYEFKDNTWHKILDWNQCCIQPTTTMTQSCVID
ncbi:uncharacterized protein LOC117111474 [Anneissia japonica]|uniref:uncharacterized protein LOC117111474 n=1 Tax=Anneissia japonica TaxID=1529436 RepID=UPI00142554E6|nr:uncharacterized protein LOC117111474 [Anneissia japonica]